MELVDVHFSYPEAVEPALAGVSLTLRRGELVGLIGQNGSGKTTLARHLNGLLQPTSGAVLVEGADIRGVEPGRLAATVGYVFQNPDHALFLTSVRAEVEYGLGLQGLDQEEVTVRAEAAMRRFGIYERAERHPASLGRGWRRLIVLAAADALEPDLLVLDEPTGGLDRRLTAELMARLEQVVAEGRCVLLISHDMQLIADHCSRVVALHAGRLAGDGTPRAIFGQSELLDRIGIARPQIGRLARRLEGRGIERGIVATGDLAGAIVARVRAADAASRRGR